jgi:hypothetical protein
VNRQRRAEATPACVLRNMCKEELYEMKCRLRGNSRLASRLDMGLERKRGPSAYISRVNDEIVKQIPLGKREREKEGEDEGKEQGQKAVVLNGIFSASTLSTVIVQERRATPYNSMMLMRISEPRAYESN